MRARLPGAFALAALLALVAAGCSAGGEAGSETAPAPLAVYGSLKTLEIAPVLLAARDHFPLGAKVSNGGIPNLVGLKPPPELGGDAGLADLATNAETQALRYSLDHPDLRIILTVAEGRYRIVARRSAGISTLEDLRGKRIATMPTTSAGYFLSAMLKEGGLVWGEVDVVRLSPVEEMAKALAARRVDAVAIWEPYAGNAAMALGRDAIEFSGEGVYRELFNLNATAASLRDPEKRARIVAFVRAIRNATAAIEANPEDAQELVASTGGFKRGEVARSWSHLDFPASLPDDLLDVLVREDAWLAEQEGREPRTRETLSKLIDRSVLEEAAGARAP